MDLLWTDFLNSIWRDWRGTGRPAEDRLNQLEWQIAFLKKWDLMAEAPIKNNELQVLMKYRTHLQCITEKLAAGRQMDQDDTDFLNAFLKETPVIRQLEFDQNSWRLEWVSTQSGWKKVLELIVSSFIQTLMDGHADRIKICDNKDCLWVYYDSTKNHSKRYCDDKACGNLLKVRKFRERQKNK
ncbi:MAG TPA: CGNR zinc finger domain-containing protein [Sporolactobacillaceae bacterium]|nr:CGNR zinc finger domain-containing protein [Sporolactobacillaceae bacterium]